MLTAQIKAASTIKELLSTHRAHESRLNHIHLSACWTSLARQAQQTLAQRRWLQTNAEALEPLVQHTLRAVIKGEFGARELANVAYGAAGSIEGKSVGVLFEAIAKEAKQRLSSNAQDAELSMAMPSMADQRLHEFKP